MFFVQQKSYRILYRRQLAPVWMSNDAKVPRTDGTKIILQLVMKYGLIAGAASLFASSRAGLV